MKILTCQVINAKSDHEACQAFNREGHSIDTLISITKTALENGWFSYTFWHAL